MGMSREEAIDMLVKDKEQRGECFISDALDMAIKALEQLPTTKNDLATIHTYGLDEGIRCAMCTNSIKSDRGCDGGCVVNNAMYKEVMDVIENHIVDTDKMVEPTTKNDLGVDCVARHDVERFIEGFINEYTPEEELEFINLELDGLKHLPPVTPQEPFKPMVEIDLYSVIKQKYIEREVLDKIRAEIDKIYKREGNSVDCLNALDELKWVIDKYKTGTEPQESEDV